MGRIKMDKSNLAERMKTYYENIPKTKLMRRGQYVDKYIYAGE